MGHNKHCPYFDPGRDLKYSYSVKYPSLFSIALSKEISMN